MLLIVEAIATSTTIVLTLTMIRGTMTSIVEGGGLSIVQVATLVVGVEMFKENN